MDNIIRNPKKPLVVFKYLFLGVFSILLTGGIIVKSKYPELVSALFAPVSVASNNIASTKIKSTDSRTNLLVLGMDKRSNNSSVYSTLTDTIMIISFDENLRKPVVISIPRDLWISETKSKINEIYALSKSKTCDEECSMGMVKKAVEKVAGIPVHYYVMIGFDAFSEAVDTVGGINVDVENTFDDYDYPIEGKEEDKCGIDISLMSDDELSGTRFSCRYEHLHFDKGYQVLDGKMALKFSRSRHSANLLESGDFARAKRQQKVLESFKVAILSAETLLSPAKISGLYGNYQRNIKTDVVLGDVLLFYNTYHDKYIGEISEVVLSNEPASAGYAGAGSLFAPEPEERDALYDKKYVLIPNDRTFDQIHVLVRQTLFE
ncbi:hypothetical protein A2982_00470 [candidate division WWE3 bacterium RIFCSPLOWO2_01_FULL_39_13]|uniref:Cell envelope-related transcriptional attenuator domain-containing protein n=1 Tax=candidate division WWE3 bacterium RIFCSPLOWO2_01_FULL_39_13 TaxID=1802624 RepID=A0A1F4V533_UNCKA|nr:MAG: hypothetical protein A2982_00470 [candidate division WWE3 bacterium RIFCSPLOWO2_01_FULL_39_13]